MKSLTKVMMLLTALLCLTGCGPQNAASTPAASTAAEPAEEPANTENDAPPDKIMVNDAMDNLQLTGPSTPVYDPYTLAERRAKGLTTALPAITPYKEGKVVYLTFDDGPDDTNTPAILDILKEQQVQATFYVLGKHAELYPDMIRRMFDEHHAIGSHSYDHIYSRIYVSPASYIAEMEKTDEILKSIIGMRPLITRAPGGAIGHFTKAYPPVLQANGYAEHDWNISSADAAPNHPVAQDFIDNVLGQIDKPNAPCSAIILMHCSEGHEETVKALPTIIQILKEHGYTFGVITPMTPSPW